MISISVLYIGLEKLIVTGLLKIKKPNTKKVITKLKTIEYLKLNLFCFFGLLLIIDYKSILFLLNVRFNFSSKFINNSFN